MIRNQHILRGSNIYKALEQKIGMVFALCTGKGNTRREESELSSYLKNNTFCLFVFPKKTYCIMLNILRA